MTRYELRRAKGVCGRNGCDTYSGSRSLCERHTTEQNARSARERIELRGVPSKRYGRALNLAGVACAAFLMLASPAARAEEPARQDAANAQPEAMSKYCARADETIEARIERLETALRLARAELVVNRKRNAPRR